MTDTTHDQTDGDQETQAVESEATETTDTTDTHDTESADTSSQEQEDDDSQVDDDSSDDDEDDSPRDEDIQKLIRKNRKTNRENQKLRERATAAEHKLAQFMAAQETGLPADMALRLQGSTPEELKADAEKLKEFFSNRRFVPGGLPSDGVRFGSDEGDSAETDLTKIGARIYER